MHVPLLETQCKHLEGEAVGFLEAYAIYDKVKYIS